VDMFYTKITKIESGMHTIAGVVFIITGVYYVSICISSI
ncbi:hypothetical protein BN863_7820, partial [Formosa agariphila KMM 3901]